MVLSAFGACSSGSGVVNTRWPSTHRDDDLARAIQARALAVREVDGVLAPVGRSLFIRDPRPAARIDRQAGPDLEPRSSGHRDRGSQGAVGLPSAQQYVKIAGLVRVERDVDPAAGVSGDAKEPTRLPACR